MTAANIRERFIQFCAEMDMSASCKPVLLCCLVDMVEIDGAVPIATVTVAFRDFHLEGLARDLPLQ